MSTKRLTLVQKPEDFFRELVTQELDSRKIQTQPETEFYLVQLMNRFLSSDQLFQKSAEGQARSEALAILLKKALEEPHPKSQVDQYRYIGDLSLYVGGFFQDSLTRKLVDVDYYIEMGGTAYRQAASHQITEETMRAVYSELSDRFAQFIDVLASIGDKTSSRSEKDILRIYELWVRTKSERAARALQEVGIVPNDTVKKDWQ